MKTILHLLIFFIVFPSALALAGAVGFINSNGVVEFCSGYKPEQIRSDPRPESVKLPEKPKPVSRQSIETIITKVQKKTGIESSLIKAVIHAESNFDHKAVSKKGAKGLMQIMPHNFKALSISDPFDPDQNIMGGTRLLKKYIIRYENRIDLALAAYNAGTKAVEKYGKVPPYEETRQYVNKVIRLYKEYKL